MVLSKRGRLRNAWLLAGVGAVLAGGAASAQDEAALKAQDAPANSIWVETLDLGKMVQGYGNPHAGKSVDNGPLTLHGTVFPHGIGTHAVSKLVIDLKGSATHFAAVVGVDDEKTGAGSVVFQVWADGKKKADSGDLHGGDAPKLLSADLTGAKHMILYVGDADDGIDSDHGDWGGALLTLAPGATETPVALPAETEEVPAEVRARVPGRYLPLPVSPKPEIHGARIVGATPGRPFLFLIAATGEAPLTFSVKGLPAGLTLDRSKGIISGSLKADGTTVAQVTVKNALGTAHRSLTIVGGKHKLAMTPPLGWNSWNVWAGNVNAERVKAAADAMLSSGLAAHGFQYVNIDDTWEGQRDADGNITCNEKFPDMKGMADYIHSKGLKVGIYSSPGPTTCAGFPASYQHEDQDAASYAKWGMDYLKYDWCSYEGVATGEGDERFQKPYRVMAEALDKVDRDILFSFCQYGMDDVWKWGEKTGGNCWRTTGDINDSWGSLHGIYNSQDGHEKYAGPGHWNDPDMLVVGAVGWGNPHPSKLTPNEQILHISMWCLLSSPMLIGCDMSHMDTFTKDLLSNDEAIDINQDTLGKPAGRVANDHGKEVWARSLADGTKAVGLLNSGATETAVTVKWSSLGISGKQPVRDLWLHKNVGSFADGYTVTVPVHGCVLLKIGKPKPIE